MERPSDTRDSVTSGTGPIVLRVENGYGFHEHITVGDAVVEATRLAEKCGGTFVVYMPVAIVTPAPRTITKNLVPDHVLEQYDHDASRPF